MRPPIGREQLFLFKKQTPLRWAASLPAPIPGAEARCLAPALPTLGAPTRQQRCRLCGRGVDRLIRGNQAIRDPHVLSNTVNRIA